MLVLRVEIRPADCDSYGHVNNAVYMTYFEQALAQWVTSHGYGHDWQSEGECSWQPESLSLEYRQKVSYGDTLEGHLWLARAHPMQPTLGFEVIAAASASGNDPAVAAFRAAGVWTRKRRDGGGPEEIPGELLTELPRAPGVLPHDWRPPSATPEVQEYRWDHRVGLSEVGPTRRVHLEALYCWLEESILDASTQAGWPLERWLAAGFLTLQTRHNTEILSLPGAGDAVYIKSRLVEARRLGGTWLLKVERAGDGQVLVRDYSTGVHLNLQGRPASPPLQITQDIQSGVTHI